MHSWHVVRKAKTHHITELLLARSPSLWTVPPQSWGWAWCPTPTPSNQALSLLILPPDLSHLSRLLDSTVPAQVHAVPLPRHLLHSCSHDLWVTLQLRQCVQNVRAITLLCSCLKSEGFLHLLSGSSLNSFTLSTESVLCRPGSCLSSLLHWLHPQKPAFLALWPHHALSALPWPWSLLLWLGLSMFCL